MSEEKSRRKPLPMVQRLQIMEQVRAADPTAPDAEIAADMSRKLGYAIATSTVSSYRSQLGIASVPMPSRAQLSAALAEANKRIEELRSPPLFNTKAILDDMNSIVTRPLAFNRSGLPLEARTAIDDLHEGHKQAALDAAVVAEQAPKPVLGMDAAVMKGSSEFIKSIGVPATGDGQQA